MVYATILLISLYYRSSLKPSESAIQNYLAFLYLKSFSRNFSVNTEVPNSTHSTPGRKRSPVGAESKEPGHMAHQDHIPHFSNQS